MSKLTVSMAPKHGILTFGNLLNIFMHEDMRNWEWAGQFGMPLSTIRARGIAAKSEPRPSRSEWARQSRNYRVSTDLSPPKDTFKMPALLRTWEMLMTTATKHLQPHVEISSIFNWQSIRSAGLRFLFSTIQRLASILGKDVFKYLRYATRQSRRIYLCQNNKRNTPALL